MDDYEEIKTLEEELVQPQTWQNRARLSELLCDEFEEIGSSGKRYGKSDVLALAATQQQNIYTLTDFTFQTLCDGCVLLKYTSSLNCSMAFRTSIWKNTNGQWKMLHHQATPVKTDH